MESKYYQDDAGTLHYELQINEEKPLIFFLHGGSPKSQHTKFWTDIISIIHRYCSPVLIDRFGHGKSKASDKVGIKDHLRALEGLITEVCDQYPTNKVALVGRSAGGAFACRLLEPLEHKVHGLGLIAPGSMKTHFKYLTSWSKPLIVLWDVEDPVVKFSNYEHLLEHKIPHDLFSLGKVEGAYFSLEHTGYKKSHVAELVAPELFESFLKRLCSLL